MVTKIPSPLRERVRVRVILQETPPHPYLAPEGKGEMEEKDVGYAKRPR